MNKATKAIRRSSIRLKSMGSGHLDLKMVISDLKDVKSTNKEFIEAQDTSWKDMTKWSKKEKNVAITECFQHFLDLNNLWTEVQLEFLEQLNKFRYQFETILEAEVNLDKMREQLVSFEIREAKLQKELQKFSQKSYVVDEMKEIEQKLKDTKSSIKAAQNEISERVNENETMKVVRLKEGLTKLSDSYVDLAKKSCYIFESHKAIASGLPEISSSGMQDMKYRGSEVAIQAVLYAKDAIKSYKRASSFSPVAPPAPRYDCPPPYQVSPSHYQYSSSQPVNTRTYPPQHAMYSPPNGSPSSVEGAVGWPPRYTEGYTSPRFMPWYDRPPYENENPANNSRRD